MDIVFTFVGDDKPGLVKTFADIVAKNKGNWLESRMTQLAGKFAGIVRISVLDTDRAKLLAAINAANSETLFVHAKEASKPSTAELQERLLTIVGNDRPGIIAEVSHALASRNINLVEMNSDVVSAAMSGESIFQADAIIEISPNLDLMDLENSLDTIANELTLDIRLESVV